MIKVFKDIYKYLQTRNLAPKLHVMDNECSKVIKAFILKKKFKIHLVEPHNHRVNATKAAVKAAKCHVVSGLATVNILFPLRLWCKFIPQMEMTMNMLRTSRPDSKISAYKDMEGAFDWNRTPLAPLGSKATVIVEASEQSSWDNHAHNAFYDGPALIYCRLKEY